MSLGSFSDGSLHELTVADVEGMLQLSESLFVEHKEGLGDADSSFRAASAIAAFANTMGGWLLIGVKNDKVVSSPDATWADPEKGALVDRIRAVLRAQVDPLPTFEAKLVPLDGRPVGIVRVYESADTPHIMVRSGAVFVRETAGVHDASTPRRAGSGAAAERKYAAVKVGSRQQLVELANRGSRARERAAALLTSSQARDIMVTPFLGFGHDGNPQNLHATNPRGKVIVRLAPLTLPARFRGWCTSHEAAASVLEAGELLSDCTGLNSSFITPHHSGASTTIEPPRWPDHHDVSGSRLPVESRAVIDNAGVAGASLRLTAPDNVNRRRRHDAGQIADAFIAPPLRAAAHILESGAFLGRARCQIDLADLAEAIDTAPASEGEADGWVPFSTELTLPLSPRQRNITANLVAQAYLRSAGIPAWDRLDNQDERIR